MNVAPGQPRASDASFLQRHPAVAYFGLTFALSWTGALPVAAPSLTRGIAIPKTTGALMFPAMLLGPSASGLVLTSLLHGKSGMRELLSRMKRIRVLARWHTALLIPPLLTLSVLYCWKVVSGNIFTKQ